MNSTVTGDCRSSPIIGIPRSPLRASRYRSGSGRATAPATLRFALAAAGAENIVALPVARRHEVAHVFDQAEHRDVHFFKHGRRFARIDQRDFLRRGDDDGAGQRDRLHDRQLDVAGARAADRARDNRARPIRPAAEIAACNASPSARAKSPARCRRAGIPSTSVSSCIARSA